MFRLSHRAPFTALAVLIGIALAAMPLHATSMRLAAGHASESAPAHSQAQMGADAHGRGESGGTGKQDGSGEMSAAAMCCCAVCYLVTIAAAHAAADLAAVATPSSSDLHAYGAQTETDGIFRPPKPA